MAEFIIGKPLRGPARRHEPLRRFLWRVDFAALWLLQKVLQLLPVDMSSRLGERIGRIVGPLMRHKTRIFQANFATAFPEKNNKEIKALTTEAWGRAGRVLGEYPHLHTFLAENDRLQIEIKAPAAVFRDTAQPAVLVSAHLSNWEVICSALAKLGIPNASLYSPPTNPLLDKMLLDSRAALNCELVPRDKSARHLMRALQKGRSVGAIIDRRVDDGHPIPFFGHNKNSTLMPAKLALKFDCDLLPVVVHRLQDARYRVIFHAPITASDPAAGEQSQAEDMTAQLHKLFEQWIREHPADWFCSKRLWSRSETGKMKTPKESGNVADINSYAA